MAQKNFLLYHCAPKGLYPQCLYIFIDKMRTHTNHHRATIIIKIQYIFLTKGKYQAKVNLKPWNLYVVKNIVSTELCAFFYSN